MGPRELSLQRLYSTFPGGWHGVGLLLLRVAIGGTLILQGSAYLPHLRGLRLEIWSVCLLAIAGGTALLVGFLTPIASSLAVLGGTGIMLSWLPTANWNVFNCNPLSLAAVIVAVASGLLGPGAFSLDAHLFGLRKVIIPRSSAAPKS
jgi:uncharacterized membrane protein YphA (DoxX/SURF4 family)